MRCSYSRRARLAPALMSIALVAACADAPTSPAAPPEPAGPRPLASLSSSLDGGALTVWADDVTGYTLHPSLSEIHATDGTVFELSAQELADAMTGFVAPYEGDKVAKALAAAPSDPRNPENMYGEGPLDLVPLAGDGGAPLPAPGGGLIVRRSESGDAPAAPRIADLDAPSLQYFPCQDIAAAIYDATLQHRASRNAVTNVLKAAVSLNFGMHGYGIRIKLANFQGLGFKLETAAHAQLTTTTQLNVLASLYSAYGCWGGSWGGSGSYPIAPSPLSMSCRREIWEISGDGGETWAPIPVTVCEYME